MSSVIASMVMATMLVSSPPGYQGYCNTYSFMDPGCRIEMDHQITAKFEETAERFRELDSVNDRFNRLIRYDSDQNTFGIPELWRAYSESSEYPRGDCDDYAVSKLQELIQRGWPRDRMTIRMGRYPGDQEDHVVLAVRFDDETIILDNNYYTYREGEIDFILIEEEVPFTGKWKRLK